MQPVSSRIWTRVAVYISSDDNHYTKGTSYVKYSYIIQIICIQLYDFNNSYLFTIILWVEVIIPNK